MAHLTILHTNDMHGSLTAAQADRLRARRTALGDAGLLVDAGDAVACGNITFNLQGEWMLDLMNRAGYDAMCLGNREFHAWRIGFAAKVRRATFPVLCANVHSRRGPGKLPVVPHTTVVTAGGVRVTFLGLTNPMVTSGMAVRHLSDFEFDLPSQVVADWAGRLRPDCDLLVALTHIGRGRDEEIARTAPAIDLVIGGHSHSSLPNGMRVGKTLVTQTGARLKHLGVIEIDFDGPGPTMVARLEDL